MLEHTSNLCENLGWALSSCPPHPTYKTLDLNTVRDESDELQSWCCLAMAKWGGRGLLEMGTKCSDLESGMAVA